MTKRICSINECPKAAYCRGWCIMHYQRWRAHGDPLVVFDYNAPRKEPVPCSIEDCTDQASSRGWCTMHYTRWRTHGDPLHVTKTGVKPKPRPVCSVDDCDGIVNSHGLCGKHDQARRRYGDPLIIKRVVIADMTERFFSNIRKEENGCWTWTGGISRDGYGMFGHGTDAPAGAHRWAYEHFVKPVPPGLELDHLCHTRERLTCRGGKACLHRRCANPDHLEPVPPVENSRRGSRAKYQEPVARALYLRWKAGETQVDLAAEAEIGQSTINRWFRRLAEEDATEEAA